MAGVRYNEKQYNEGLYNGPAVAVELPATAIYPDLPIKKREVVAY